MLTLFILSFLLTALITASLVIAWFESSLPVHVFALACKLGIGKNNTAAWETFDEFTMSDWQVWLAVHWSYTWAQMFFGTLITCPICLSFHISAWTSLTISVGLYMCWIACPLVFLFVLPCTFGCPVIAILLHSYFQKLHK